MRDCSGVFCESMVLDIEIKWAECVRETNCRVLMTFIPHILRRILRASVTMPAISNKKPFAVYFDAAYNIVQGQPYLCQMEGVAFHVRNYTESVCVEVSGPKVDKSVVQISLSF